MSAVQKKRFESLSVAALLFLISGIIYSQYGFNGSLLRDDALYLYSGQQFAKGIPPYVSCFDAKTPLTTFIIGFAVRAAERCYLDDILVVRATFLFLACLAVAALYALSEKLFTSRRLGILAALTFVGYWGYGRHAASGPRPNTALVLFEILALLFTAQRMWFWAGVCGSLAFLTWQPTVAFVVITIVLALTQSESRADRVRNLLDALFGFGIPVVSVSAYLISRGAFAQFVRAAFLFPISDLATSRLEARPLAAHFLRPIEAVEQGYPSMTLPIFLGLVMVALLYVWRIRTSGGVRAVLGSDPFAGLLLSFPAPLAWSLIDFQDYPDFFVLLPYAAIGFAWLISLAVDAVQSLEKAGAATSKLSFILICTVLTGTAARGYRRTAETGLEIQRARAQQIQWQFQTADDGWLLSIGKPDILVLLHKTSRHPYLSFFKGVYNLIDTTASGGFSGWLGEQLSSKPSAVVVGPLSPAGLEDFVAKQLEAYGYRRTGQIGGGVLFHQPGGTR